MKKLNITFLLTMLMSMVGLNASAHDIAVKNADGKTIYYNFINDNTELAVTYRGSYSYSYSNEYMGNVVIPKSVTYNEKTYSVTSIGDAAFSSCSGLTAITIPNSVTSIGSYAFNGCSGLTSITIPNSVTSIGNYAFSSCSKLTSVDIPNSVTTIGKSAFDNCSGLTSVTIGNSLTSIGKSAFFGCSGLTSVTWNAKKYTDFSYHGDAPFYDLATQIKEFKFGEGVETIPTYLCIGMTGLTSITVPNSVTSIGNAAFYNCTGLKKVIVKDITAWLRIEFGTTANPLIYAQHLYSDEDTEITNLIIPNSVKSIGNYAFHDCSGLTSVTIPNSVTSIGYWAFSGCSGLTSITIPNSVTSIGDCAFQCCYGLTSITIPNSVTSIANSAFQSCSELTSIKVQEGNTKYDSRSNCNAIIETATNKLVIGCKNTTIPNSVTSIGIQAFSGCSGLTSITIPNSVTSIGNYAFYYCSGLTSITIPNSVTSIGRCAFYACSGLTSITIPNSVTSIGENAFYYCDNLLFVYALSEYPSFVNIGDNSFPMSQSHFKSTLYVKKGLKDLYSQADGWKDFVDIREMTNEQYTELVKKADGDDGQEETIVNLAVTLSSAGYATFYNDSRNFKLPAGLSALVLTSESGQTLNYKTIASGDANGIIPKGVAVIIVSNNRKGGTYTLTSTTESASYSGTNLLHGSSLQTMTSNVNGVSTSGNSNYVYYKLAYGRSGSASASKLGWYWGANNGAAFSIAGGKAWLALPKSSAQSLDAILLEEDGATSIEGIEQSNMNEANDAQYNMAGQRVGNGYNGIIIVNGKKVIR